MRAEGSRRRGLLRLAIVVALVVAGAAVAAALLADEELSGDSRGARIERFDLDSNYWNAHMRAYLRFYADALARCRR